MTPSGIEPVTSQFVAQHLNHCATAVPHSKSIPTNAGPLNILHDWFANTEIICNSIVIYGIRNQLIQGYLIGGGTHNGANGMLWKILQILMWFRNMRESH